MKHLTTGQRRAKIKSAKYLLLKHALIWHAVKVFKIRYPGEKEDQNIRRAAIRLLKLNPSERELRGGE